MKRYFLAALTALLLAATMFAEGKANAQFKDKTHNFGTIREADGPVTTEFPFTNDGDAPLVIVSAVASCGCTSPEYPRKPVQPGESGVIKVTYDPAGRPGEFSKTITVRTPDKRIKLRIKGNVIPKN
ncbi:MAG: DUF1573 domain-containing protein [Muribaculaceae bacterium]|nr:DUF1573 domain-containing protein [Muribaculaceae bacterium]